MALYHVLAGKKGQIGTRKYRKKLQKERIKKYKENSKYCKLCKKILPYKKRKNIFCSSSCAITFSNKGQIRSEKWKDCLFCRKRTKNNKFCCHKCCTNYYKNIEKQLSEKRILQGKEHNPRRLKQFLIEKYGEKCMICGWNEKNPITKKIPIELHHKDGNSDHDQLTNLQLLCPNHHSLTPSYRNIKHISSRKQRLKRRKYRPQ